MKCTDLKHGLLGVVVAIAAGCAAVPPTSKDSAAAPTQTPAGWTAPAGMGFSDPQRFLAHFNPAARSAFEQVRASGSMETLNPRLVGSSLAECYAEPSDLALACFRALGEGLTWWHADDGLTAAAQTAVEEMPIEAFMRVLDLARDDELALRGAARVYFRFNLATRVTPEARTAWTVRLADIVMRRGYPADQALALHALGGIDDASIAPFLREVAAGRRKYPEDTRQPVPSAEVHSLEPSWACAAALMLAYRGDRSAGRFVRQLERTHRGASDVFALALARAALDDEAPFPSKAFSAYSFLLGTAALDLVERRDSGGATADMLVAAAKARMEPVATEARARIRRLGLNLSTMNLPSTEPASVSEYLVAEHPRRAIAECDRLLPAAKDELWAKILAFRAQAHRNLGEVDAALADYRELVKSPWARRTEAEIRVAWMLFNAGRIDEAAEAVNRAFAARGQPTDEQFLLRGLVAYANDDFSAATEDDFIAAAKLAPANGYALLLQHLTASLRGHPEASRVRAASAAALAPGDGFTIATGGVSLQFGNVGIAWWPRRLIGFFRGEIDDEELLRNAGVVPQQRAEAYFYLSQAARLAGQPADERRWLERCVETKLYPIAEYHLAVERRRRLDAAGDGATTASAEVR